jgi:signal transduction histidine kinase
MKSVRTGAALRILLVEDNEDDRLAFRRAFQGSRLTFEITECTRGEEALERLDSDASSFDLAVIDHGLPGMSGLELCKELLHNQVPLPLMILTGKGSEELAVEALKAGVSDYMIKDPGRGYLDLLPVVLPEVVRRHGDRLARKAAEAELQKINEELKNFVHVVSHDLRTPITFIQGFSSLLLDKYQDALDDKGRMCVKRIYASARRMEALVSDLLALSKIGRVVSSFQDVSCSEIVNHLASDLQDRLASSGIELVVAENLPAICCDGGRVRQVLENLVVNAIKFMGNTQSPRIEISFEDRGDVLEFCVKDNGIGIDPKHHSAIFEKFHRLRDIEDDEGTGLGLAIVKRIVNNHGGKVWVESQRGKGASFYFILPKDPKEREPSAAPA